MDARYFGREEARRHLLLLLILCLALLLRANGLGWGLPNLLHPDYSYHPDEAYFLSWAQALGEGRWIPKLFQYGGTGFYALLVWINAAGHWYTEHFGGLPVRNAILIGRIANIAVSLATILATYWLASLFTCRRVALAACALLAVMPAHIFWAVRVRPDEVFTLLIMLNLLVAAHFLLRQAKGLQLVAAGLLLGATVAVRFPAGALIFTYAFALFQGPHHRPWRAMAIGAAAALLGYTLASPGTFLYPDLWLQGMSIQWRYQTSGPVGSLMDLPGGIQYFSWVLSEAMGLPLYLMGLGALAFAARRRLPAAGLFLSFFIPYSLMLASASWIMARYTIPLLPILCIWMAARLNLAWQKRQAVTASTLTLAMLATLMLDIAYADAIREPDPRDSAGLWLQRHITSNTRLASFIGYRGDLFSTPPLLRGHWFLYQLKDKGIGRFLASEYDYIIVHSHWLDALSGPPAKRELTDWLNRQHTYRLVASFEKQPKLFDLPFGWAFASSDFRLALPTIYIWQHVRSRGNTRGTTESSGAATAALPADGLPQSMAAQDTKHECFLAVFKVHYG